MNPNTISYEIKYCDKDGTIRTFARGVEGLVKDTENYSTFFDMIGDSVARKFKELYDLPLPDWYCEVHKDTWGGEDIKKSWKRLEKQKK